MCAAIVAGETHCRTTRQPTQSTPMDFPAETRLLGSSGTGGSVASPPRTEAEAKTKRKRHRRIRGVGLVAVGARVITGIVGPVAIARMAVAGVMMAVIAMDVAARADIGRPGARVGRLRYTNSRRQRRRGGDRFNPTRPNKHDHRQAGCTDPCQHRDLLRSKSTNTASSDSWRNSANTGSQIGACT